MGVAKPSGQFVERMLEPGGWPHVDEELLQERAQQLVEVAQSVTLAQETFLRQRGELFDGDAWSGAAAGAAGAEFQTRADGFVSLQHGLATAIKWHNYVAGSIAQAKSVICDNVEAADRTIRALMNDESLKEAERVAAIDRVVDKVHGANIGVVGETAELIAASKSWRPADDVLPALSERKLPPSVVAPDTPRNPVPSPSNPPVQPVVPSVPPLPPIVGPGVTPVPGVGPVVPVPSAGPVVPVPGAGPVAPVPGVGPVAPISGGGPVAPVPGAGPVAPGVPTSPSAGPQSPPAAAAEGKGMTPASVSEAPARSARPTRSRADDSAPSAAPAAGPGTPLMSPSSTGGAKGAQPGSAGARAPVTQETPAANPRSRSTAPKRPAARKESLTAAPQKPEDRSTAVAAGGQIPVSAARAERDAITQAAAPEAARREGSDALLMARRVAAALNAPNVVGYGFMGFFWLTAVTTDGSIVVANSYGVAYLPEGVLLPEHVCMASADSAIPVTERARWATYPLLALQGWAAHHEKTLRAVIATAEQFAGSDPGATKVVLESDDIPSDGQMDGRSRLEVVDPPAAARLASTPDARLAELLPSAPPVGGAGDASLSLWFDVMTSLSSDAESRRARHLKALHGYAAAAAVDCLARARSAGEPDATRECAADWMYWKFLAGLLGPVVGVSS